MKSIKKQAIQPPMKPIKKDILQRKPMKKPHPCGHFFGRRSDVDRVYRDLLRSLYGVLVIVTDVTGIIVAVTEGGGRETEFSEVGEREVTMEGVEDEMDAGLGESGLPTTTDLKEVLEAVADIMDTMTERRGRKRRIGGREEGT